MPLAQAGRWCWHAAPEAARLRILDAVSISIVGQVAAGAAVPFGKVAVERVDCGFPPPGTMLPVGGVSRAG